MIHLAYSELRDYRKCPRLFQKKHVEQRQEEDDPKRAFVGNVLGRLVERFYLDRFWVAPDTIDWTMTRAAERLMRETTDADKIVWTADEKAEVTHKILEAIPVIIATIKQEKLLSREVETETETELHYTDIVPGDTVVIHGRIDYRIHRKPTLTILDGKGGGTFGKFTDRNQLRQYALATWKSAPYRRIPDRVGFWWFRHGKIVWMKVSEKSLTKFEGEMKETAKKAIAGPYEPTPGQWCHGCSFRMECPEGRAHGMTKGSKVVVPVEANVGTVSL